MSGKVIMPQAVSENTLLKYSEFNEMSRQAQVDPDAFWSARAKTALDWITPFTVTRRGDFHKPCHVEWFSDGTLNVSANCLDRHLVTQPDKTALIWVGDGEDEEKIFTYRALAAHVGRWANLLKSLDVKKGDRVVLYLPMIPEAMMAMLACARIGAVHSMVFGGFSASALRDRIIDSGARVVITANQGLRGGKPVPLKETVDQALDGVDTVSDVLVVRRTAQDVAMRDGRDRDVAALLEQESPDCAAETMGAEDPLFILYTSGSTGKPKGLVHTQAGYLLYAAETFRVLFDYRPDDVYFCTADIGWITGHSYIVYGPLANGATTLMFEGVPTWPKADRYWKIVDRYKVTIFYTAPTALRSLMRLGDEALQGTSRGSLRVLASVGEPINPEAWLWYFHKVGHGKCTLVDTWWQTETGGHMIAPPPSMPVMKPGCAMTPFFGIEPVLVDTQSRIIEGEGEGALFLKQPWPGMARTIYGDHARFVDTYFAQMDGLYCSGDGAVRDADGDYRITGRVDDVINVSGHRFGTAEIESALVAHPAVAEAAVVGRDHDVKGTGIYAYVTLHHGAEENDALKQQLNSHVRGMIGAIASLDWIQFAGALPKTRSGKILRRVLRKIAAGEADQLGDLSTLADPEIVDELVRNRHNQD